jgi:hypothetical protein
MSLTIKQGRRKEPRRIQGCDREDARIRVRSLFRSRTQIGNIISRPWDHQTLVMKLPSNIPILHATNGELLAGSPRSAVVLSSARSNWHVKYVQHVVCVSEGRVVTFETKKDGRRHRVLERGAVSLFPSHCPFFSRRKKGENGSAHVLLVALDPVFVKQTVASLEVYPDRVELIQQRGRTDPTLRHIAMALRDGLQSGRAATKCMVKPCRLHWRCTCCVNMAALF